MNIISVALICLVVPQLAHSQKTRKSEAASWRGHDEIISQLRAAYAAFNRGDFDAAVAVLDPNIEWTEPLEFPGGGTYHGREAVKRYLMQSRAGWAEGSSEPEQFVAAGDRIVVFVRACFRLKESNEWHEVRLADVYSVRRSKIVQMTAFVDRQHALSWAGANSSNGPVLHSVK